MVDIPKMYSDLCKTFEGTGVRVELVSSGESVDDKLVKAIKGERAEKSSDTSPTSKAGAEVLSKEKAKYKDLEGVLIRYADGSIEFQTSKKKGTLCVLKFKNEKDFNSHKPAKQFVGTVDQDHKFTKVKEITYKYHMNGKKSYEEVKDSKGTILSKTNYNRKGKPENKVVYDKDGKLQNTYKYKYEGDDTQLIQKFDNENKLVLNETVKYNGDKRVSAEGRYPDGQIASQKTYDANGKLATSKEYYKNGQIKADTVYYDNGVIKTQTLYDEQGQITKKITDEIDGKFDASSQKGQGDCYLMSTINAIRQMEGGQEVLSNLVKISTNEKGEKVYTVTLPGAQLAAKGLTSDSRIKPDTCAITGEYTFTESEMQEILKQAGQKYSIGDGDIILLEAAFEKYREEVNQTLKANGIDPKAISPEEAGLYTGYDEDNILSGGKAEDALFILTGKQSQVFNDKAPTVGLSLEDLKNGTATPTNIPAKDKPTTYVASAKSASPVQGEVSHERTELNNMLDRIMEDSADGHIDNPATVAFKTIDKNGKVSGHALTIKSVTADTVVMVNPWHPDKELVMSREEFQNTAYHLTITPMDENNTGIQENQNTNQIPPSLLNAINQHLQSQQSSSVSGEGNNVASTPSTSSNPSNDSVNQNGNTHTPEVYGTYTIPRNISYTNMIKQMLKEQGIEPTKENITKAKEQFEELNPNAVKTYNGKRADWKGNRYVLYGDKVKVPKFEME